MKKFAKAIIIAIGVANFAAIMVCLVNVYGKKGGFDYKLISHTVEINAPADSVFKFLGNSANAHRWSVFVDHISPLNSDVVKD